MLAVSKSALTRSVNFLRQVLRGEKNAGNPLRQVSEEVGERYGGGVQTQCSWEGRPCCSLGWWSAGCAGLAVRKEDSVGLSRP